MQYLRQSTASQSVLLGPFIDDTDGKTAETGLTIANTDIRLSANGGNMAAKNSGGGTHDEAGWYTVTFDATDSATVGRLQVSVDVAGALPVFAEFQVLEEAVYDALFAASAPGYLQPTTSGRTLDVTATGAAGIDWGNVENPSTSVDLSATAISLCDTVTTNSDMRGTDSAATHSAADVWSVATRVLTANTNLNDPTAAAIAAEVWDTTTLSHTTAGTFGRIVGLTYDNTVSISGQITGLNNLSAADVNAQCDTAISDYFGTAGDGLTSIPWNSSWDAEVQSECADAISAVFTFTVSGQVDANMQSINDTALVGDGSATPWGPTS